MEAFLKDAICVLQEKGFKKHCHALNALSQVVEANSKIVKRKVLFYKWSGLFLLTAIPLVSALLSVSVGLKNGDASWLEATILSLGLPLSLFLTIATILSSIFRPNERFRNACIVGIRIDSFKGEMLSALERMETIEESALLDLVDKKRKEFEKYQEELIGMFMPMEVSAQRGSPGGGKVGRG